MSYVCLLAFLFDLYRNSIDAPALPFIPRAALPFILPCPAVVLLPRLPCQPPSRQLSLHHSSPRLPCVLNSPGRRPRGV